MDNPYKILGVSPNATDAEIKKAYRELAKKYHPDNYVNNPLADLASEKMKQINEAYDAITKMRSSRNLNNDQNTQHKAYTETEIRVRHLIDEGRISEAEVLLNKVGNEDRGAEWHFLMGCVCLRRGWLLEARNHAEIANRIDPTNQEYISLLRNVSGSQTRTSGGDCSLCDICTFLACMDCMCDCCR